MSCEQRIAVVRRPDTMPRCVLFRTLNAATRMLRLTVAMILFLAAMATSALAQSYDIGLRHYTAGRYAQALKIWRPLANQGDAKAQYNIGAMYDHGIGVAQNDKNAVTWYRRAAEQGNASAQFNLGNMYSGDRGLPRDIQSALYWLRKAAEQGEVSAQFNLAMKYHRDPAVQDPARAAEWYAKAAEQNHVNATVNLGVLYMAGLGVAKDDARAVELYRKGAEQGHALAQTYLGDMYRWGRGVQRDDAAAVSWHRKAAEQGEFQGLLKMAIAYSDGIGVPRDSVLASVFATHDPKRRKFDLLERSQLANDLKDRLTEEQRTEVSDIIAAWTASKPSPTTSRTGRP
jgi:uncharacterized protein